jgi:hypothetical protein
LVYLLMVVVEQVGATIALVPSVPVLVVGSNLLSNVVALLVATLTLREKVNGCCPAMRIVFLQWALVDLVLLISGLVVSAAAISVVKEDVVPVVLAVAVVDSLAVAVESTP